MCCEMLILCMPLPAGPTASFQACECNQGLHILTLVRYCGFITVSHDRGKCAVHAEGLAMCSRRPGLS